MSMHIFHPSYNHRTDITHFDNFLKISHSFPCTLESQYSSSSGLIPPVVYFMSILYLAEICVLSAHVIDVVALAVLFAIYLISISYCWQSGHSFLQESHPGTTVRLFPALKVLCVNHLSGPWRGERKNKAVFRK